MDVFCRSSGGAENKEQQSWALSIHDPVLLYQCFPDFYKRRSRVGWWGVFPVLRLRL